MASKANMKDAYFIRTSAPAASRLISVQNVRNQSPRDTNIKKEWTQVMPTGCMSYWACYALIHITLTLLFRHPFKLGVYGKVMTLFASARQLLSISTAGITSMGIDVWQRLRKLSPISSTASSMQERRDRAHLKLVLSGWGYRLGILAFFIPVVNWVMRKPGTCREFKLSAIIPWVNSLNGIIRWLN